MSLAVALSTIRVTVRFGLIPPQFSGRTLLRRSGAFYLFSPSTNRTRGFAARSLLRVTLCSNGTIHLQTFMSSPGFEPKPNSTEVSVINHYTG
ncbi:hypothetical protein TNCV_1462981 [Trichonephila clavipes]|uniref:Uncharacterized protein n=1 Tax=Trichonephila clavipes TaxID=2585209 RepID=A0A8X6SFA8_TRICX|nr:hypothetical protein TNCV_1462981 [Trichonephila clavipes]